MILGEVLFLLTLLLLIFLFYKREGANTPGGEKPTGFSIIIPFKNEERNLLPLLESLQQQKLSIPFEVILIDDGSTDKSREIIESFRCLTIEIFLFSSTYSEETALSSKQQAIELGVSKAKYEWFIFTDADMVFNTGWLHSLFESVDNQKNRMVFGRTGIVKDSLFSSFQHIQLQFLFASAWFLTKSGIDSSCMGNNIAIQKSLYQEIGGQYGIGYSIVEDKKLFNKARELGVQPQPSKHFYTFANTRGERTLKGFLHQQMRWLKGGMGESKQLSALILIFSLHIIITFMQNFATTPPEIQSLLIGNWAIVALLFFSIFIKIKAAKDIPLLLLYFLFVPIEAIVLLVVLPFWKVRWKGKAL